jgi:uncharacterized DUF497 family protein
MEMEFDPAKDAMNIKKHGLPLGLAARLDWDNAIHVRDERFPYDEIRVNAIVPLGSRLYFVSYTEHSERLRIISLRYANKREVADYVQSYP